MVQKNQKLVVEIVDLSSEGAGVAKVEGYPIFVKDTLVGEKVEILVLRANKNYGFGKAINIIEASPDRVEPKCPVAMLNVVVALFNICLMIVNLDIRRIKSTKI